MKGLRVAVCLQSLSLEMQLTLRVWKSLEFVKSEMDLTAMHRESCCKLYQLCNLFCYRCEIIFQMCGILSQLHMSMETPQSCPTGF